MLCVFFFYKTNFHSVIGVVDFEILGILSGGSLGLSKRFYVNLLLFNASFSMGPVFKLVVANDR